MFQPVRQVAAFVALLQCCGCSLLFVQSPPDVAPHAVRSSGATECTSSKAAPILDTLFTSFEVGRTVFAATAPSSDYDGALLSREADIGLGLGFTALFLGSAIYGYSSTSKCRALNSAPDEAPTRETWAPTPTERPRARPEPAPPPPPATAAPPPDAPPTPESPPVGAENGPG